jgi:hypothetical protein
LVRKTVDKLIKKNVMMCLINRLFDSTIYGWGNIGELAKCAEFLHCKKPVKYGKILSA